MMLKYRILWFEDNPVLIESLGSRIKRFLIDFGFEPEIKPKPDDSEIDLLLESIEEFNLILMDYNLNSGPTVSGEGKKILKKIRDNDLYTEVVFYSGVDNLSEARQEGFDGVFFTEKDKLFEKVKAVITLTIKKNQDINNIRGLVISEAIDLEEKMENALIKCFNFTKEEADTFKMIFDPDFAHFSFNNKFSMINIALNKKKEALSNILQEASKNGIDLEKEEKKRIVNEIEYINSFKRIFISAENEVIGIRNTLAHVKPHEKNKLISRSKNGGEIIIDDEWCKKTRADLIKHSKNLDTFLNRVT